jgi:flagellar hook-associated protein 3 FlgL
MRVTTQMIYDAATRNAGQSRERLQDVVGQISSGRKVVHPSDDPAAAALMIRYKGSADRFDAIGQTLGSTQDELDAADTSLQQASSLLTRARQLAMQFGNDSYSATDRVGGANEIDAIVNGLTQALNVQVGNRYIFAGNKDATPAFDATGNYLGDAGVRQVEVAPGVIENASIRADVAFKGAGGGTDVFKVLTDLATAMRNNDGTAIRGSLTGVDAGMKQVGTAMAQVGGMSNLIDTARNANLELRDRDTELHANVADVDVVEAASKMQLANQALEATLSATARSFQLTLVDKLG